MGLYFSAREGFERLKTPFLSDEKLAKRAYLRDLFKHLFDHRQIAIYAYQPHLGGNIIYNGSAMVIGDYGVTLEGLILCTSRQPHYGGIVNDFGRGNYRSPRGMGGFVAYNPYIPYTKMSEEPKVIR